MAKRFTAPKPMERDVEPREPDETFTIATTKEGTKSELQGVYDNLMKLGAQPEWMAVPPVEIDMDSMEEVVITRPFVKEKLQEIFNRLVQIGARPKWEKAQCPHDGTYTIKRLMPKGWRKIGPDE